MFVTAIVFAVIALILLVVAVTVKFYTVERELDPDDRFKYINVKHEVPGPRKWLLISAAAVGGIALLFTSLASFYTQDPGEANVLRSWTGEVVGFEDEQGLHFKAPWVNNVTFDVRNQRAVFVSEQNEGEGDNAGGRPDGPQITVQDGEGVTANIDIAIRYSVNPGSVVDIYSQYLNEENLRTRLIFNDIRSVVRSVPGSFNTLELLTNRDAVQQAIFEALEARWENDGIIVEDVALQEIRYGESVRTTYALAQEAQINVATEQARLEAVQVSAQQKVVQAQAEADANALLDSSLTPAILQQRYLDTLKELAAAGNLVITDGSGADILVQRTQ